jgi:hypothetical protein
MLSDFNEHNGKYLIRARALLFLRPQATVVNEYDAGSGSIHR